jgi:hypothetical protein
VLLNKNKNTNKNKICIKKSFKKIDLI